MTVRLLVDFKDPADGKQYVVGNLYTSAANEVGMIASKMATSDLTGGTAWVAPVVPESIDEAMGVFYDEVDGVFVAKGVRLAALPLDVNGNIIQRASKIGGANKAPFSNHATSTYNFLGFDATDSVAWVNDTTGGFLRQGTTTDGWKTQAGTTWSTNKGFPSNVTYANVSRMMRFKTKLYMLALDTVSGLRKVSSAAPASGNTAFSWADELSFATNATSLPTGLTCDDRYIYAAEYTQQASFSPAVYRSTGDGTWETCYGPDNTIRHVHCIAADPYNPGHLWMTCGDGTAKSVQRSTDYGTTWSVVIASSVWQAVEISFTPDYIYFAGDSQYGIVYRMDRSTLTPRWVTPQLLQNIPVLNPAALTDQYYFNAWFGAVDPSSGDYYCSANDVSAGGNTAGLFLIREGESPILVSKFSSIQGNVVIAGGVLWVGMYRKILNDYS